MCLFFSKVFCLFLLFVCCCFLFRQVFLSFCMYKRTNSSKTQQQSTLENHNTYQTYSSSSQNLRYIHSRSSGGLEDVLYCLLVCFSRRYFVVCCFLFSCCFLPSVVYSFGLNKRTNSNQNTYNSNAHITMGLSFTIYFPCGCSRLREDTCFSEHVFSCRREHCFSHK